MTVVNWNGSGATQPLETLFARLQTNTLDPTFERYGNFVFVSPGLTKFWGNFYDYSHCFSVESDEPLIVEALIKAIRTNQQTEAYKTAKAEILDRVQQEQERERQAQLRRQELRRRA